MLQAFVQVHDARPQEATCFFRLLAEGVLRYLITGRFIISKIVLLFSEH